MITAQTQGCSETQAWNRRRQINSLNKVCLYNTVWDRKSLKKSLWALLPNRFCNGFQITVFFFLKNQYHLYFFCSDKYFIINHFLCNDIFSILLKTMTTLKELQLFFIWYNFFLKWMFIFMSCDNLASYLVYYADVRCFNNYSILILLYNSMFMFS